MRKSWTMKEIFPARSAVGGIIYNHAPFTKTPNGKIFGSAIIPGATGEAIVISTDNWGTLSPACYMPPGSGKVSSMYAVNDNTLLIGTITGKIYRTVNPFSTLTLVMTMTTPLAYPRPWSFAGKGNVVFVGEYGNKNTSNNARRVYRSIDAGVSWAEVFQIDNVVGAHVHKLLLDPFTDVLWVCSGDFAQAKIRKVDPPNYNVGTIISTTLQPTGGIAFQDFILWCQDGTPYGVIKQNKADNSFSVVLDLATEFPNYADTIYHAMILDSNNKLYIATSPDVKRGDVGLFSSNFPYDHWVLEAQVPKAAHGKVGIDHFISVDSDNLGIIALYQHGETGTGKKGVAFKNFKKNLRA